MPVRFPFTRVPSALVLRQGRELGRPDLRAAPQSPQYLHIRGYFAHMQSRSSVDQELAPSLGA